MMSNSENIGQVKRGYKSPPKWRSNRSVPAMPRPERKPWSSGNGRQGKNHPFHVIHKLPAGNSPYAKAKRVQMIDKDPRRAVPLFWTAINAGDRVDSALKDMVLVMKQLNRPDEGIEAIKTFRHRCLLESQVSLDNVLVELYKRSSRFEEQIQMLQLKIKNIEADIAFNGKRTKMARSQGKTFQITIEKEYCRLLGNLAWAHLQLEEYKSAEANYRKALALETDKNKQCNLAICLIHLNEITEAQSLLESVRVSCTNEKRDESCLRSLEHATRIMENLEMQNNVKPMRREVQIKMGKEYSRLSGNLITGGFTEVIESETSQPQMADAKGSSSAVPGCDVKAMGDGCFNGVTKAIESETSHPQMAGAKGSSSGVADCDGKVMGDWGFSSVTKMIEYETSHPQMAGAEESSSAGLSCDGKVIGDAGFNTVAKVIESETNHSHMAGAKGLSCTVPGCDGKVMKDERGEDILSSECYFRICRNCYLDAVKTGDGICPGCKEPYKNTDLAENAVDPGQGPCPLPSNVGMSKMARRLSLMRSANRSILTKGHSGLMRSQTGDIDHNQWVFETKVSYGYGNAIRPKERDSGNDTSGNGGGGGEPAELLNKPWMPLICKLKIPAAVIRPYQ